MTDVVIAGTRYSSYIQTSLIRMLIRNGILADKRTRVIIRGGEKTGITRLAKIGS